MREIPLAPAVRPGPLVEHGALDAPDRLLFGDAGVGDAVEVPVEQRLLVVRRQVAVVGNAHVVVVRHQVEEVLFEVRAGAADAVDLALADHLGQRQAQLGRAHGAGEGHEHVAAAVQVRHVGVGGINEGGTVEVPEMVVNESG